MIKDKQFVKGLNPAGINCRNSIPRHLEHEYCRSLNPACGQDKPWAPKSQFVSALKIEPGTQSGGHKVSLMCSCVGF